MLFGSAFFFIPDIGPLLAAGPLLAWVVGGLSAVGAGLVGVGIPKDSVVQYELDLKTDRYLLVIQDIAAQVAKAREIIASTNPYTPRCTRAKSWERARGSNFPQQ
jgi:hypothetical protein